LTCHSEIKIVVRWMFLSFVCGIIISKFVKDRSMSFLAAIAIGALIGILGAFGVFGVTYPFYIAADPDIISIPEVVPFGVYFVARQIKIYSFSSGWLSSSPFIPLLAIVFIIASIVSVLIGQLAGNKWFLKSNI
jgi:uncharacterized membrane protein (DUF373 family)